MAPLLGYWTCRGVAQYIRLFLAHVGEKYEEKLYVCGPPPNYEREEWLKEKFELGLLLPNLPYYIDGDHKITQSHAILRYLARKYNLAGNTEKELIAIDMVEHQMIDLQKDFFRFCFNPDYDKIKDEFSKQLATHLKQLSTFLGKHKYFAGDKLTYVDFLVFTYLYDILKFNSKCLDEFPNLKEYYNQFKELPKVKNFLSTSPAAKYPLSVLEIKHEK